MHALWMSWFNSYLCKDTDCSIQVPVFLLNQVGNDEKAGPVVAMGAVYPYDLHRVLLEEVGSYAVEIIHLNLSGCLPIPAPIHASNINYILTLCIKLTLHTAVYDSQCCGLTEFVCHRIDQSL